MATRAGCMEMVIVSSNGEPPADRISQWDSSAPVWMSSLSKSSLSDFLNWFLGQESQKTDSYHLGAMDPVDTNMDDRRKIEGRKESVECGIVERGDRV
jgi:hypothetical protein